MDKLKKIIDIIEELSPKSIAYSWDNVGLQVGGINRDITKVLVCLDINEETINEAIEKGTQLIIAHHPLIFSPIKSVTFDDYKGRLIIKAINNGINIYVAHTNIDAAEKGLNNYVASLLNLKDLEILEGLEVESYYKIVVFVPKGHEDKVAEALAMAGAGHIGNYSNCSFRLEGEGTFMPLEGTNPFVGENNKLERVKETRLETIVPYKKLNNAIQSMIAAHPYEEVAYDVYRLYNDEESRIGIGRIGSLDEPILFKDYISIVKDLFNVKFVKAAGKLDEEIQKIAIVNGSGSDFISKAAREKCDLLITGDIKLHDAQKAAELNLKLLDIGHYESEILFTGLIKYYLSEKLQAQNMDIEIIVSANNGNPFNII